MEEKKNKRRDETGEHVSSLFSHLISKSADEAKKLQLSTLAPFEQVVGEESEKT